MAEFQEVMKQWRRFCKSHDNCGECEFDGRGICGKAHMSDVPYSDMELRIMAWAAEHPEPVYPTWAQYFNKIRISNGCKPLLSDAELLKVICSRIPSDMAQKLGVPPKPIDYCKEAYRSEDGIMHIRKTPIYPIEPKEVQHG